MELPDKSRAYSELIVDSLRIKNNIINDFVNGPTLTYTGHYDVFRLIDIDAFTVTVTLPERYDKVDVKLVPLSGSIPDDPFVSIDSVTGPAILKEVRNVTVVSPTSITFTTIDGDHFWVTAYGAGGDSPMCGRNSRGEPDQWTCEVHPKIVPPNDHGVYSSALTSLMCGTVVLPSTTYMEAANTARSRPGALVIANVAESASDLIIAFNNQKTGLRQPIKYTDGTYLTLCSGAVAMLNPSKMSFSMFNTDYYDYLLGAVDQKVFHIPSTGGYYINGRLTGWNVRNTFEDNPTEYTIKVPEGNPEGEGVIGIVNNKAYAIMARPSAPVLVADLTNTPDNTITFTATDMLRGAATGYPVGALGDMLFMHCEGISGGSERPGLVCINSSTNKLTEHSGIANISARLTTADLIYIEYTPTGKDTHHIGTLSATGEFKQGGIIGDDTHAYLFVKDNDIYAVVIESIYNPVPAELKKIDPVTLELSPTTEIDGWKEFKFNTSLMVSPSMVVVGGDIVTVNVFNAGLYFMVANADGDIDEVSIAQGGARERGVSQQRCSPQAVPEGQERKFVPQPTELPQRIPSASPLSTSLRSRYARQ